MTIPSADYELGVANECERIAKRLRAAWKMWGPDGVLDLMDELETGVRNNALDVAEDGERPYKP